MKELSAKLSNREKRMIVFLICFLVVVGGWTLLIQPTLTKRTQLKAEYESVSLSASQTSDVSMYTNAPAQVEEVKAKIQSLSSQFHEQLTNEELDNLYTTTILARGMNPLSLSITDKSSASKDTSTSFPVMKVSTDMSVEGTMEQVEQLIDDLQAIDGVRVTKMQFSSASTNQQTSSSLSVVMYMKVS